MLLSFKPEVYEKIKSGKKKFEHRRNFPDEPIMAYMYVSAPIKAIKGIVYLGKRHLLSDWREEFKNDKAAVVRIEKYQELYRYAMEINEFQETTEISLGALRRDVSGFVAPQMYACHYTACMSAYLLLKYGKIRNESKSIAIFDGPLRHQRNAEYIYARKS